MNTIISVVICIIGMLFQTAFMEAERREKLLPALLLKSCASFIFVIIGINSFNESSHGTYARLVLAGLILGAAGDILLNLQYFAGKYSQAVFLTGVFSFFAGHVMYLLAIFPLRENHVAAITAGVLAAILILTVLFKMLKPDTVYKVFGILYIGTVSIMCAVSLQNMITIASRQSAVFAAGAVLFLISDVVLIFNIFGNRVSHLRRVINLSCYYIAQLLIAITIML